MTSPPAPPSRTDAMPFFAALVDAIGGSDFTLRFMDAMRAVAGVDLCSAFRHDGVGGVTLLFATGERTPADFPLEASRAYLRDYWRSDVQILRLARMRGATPTVMRRRAVEIADPAYRESCYDRAGVTERLSILCPGPPCLVVNGYRTACGASDSTEAFDRLERHARLLVATLRQHLRLQGTKDWPHDKALLAERLMALDCGLSAREAEVSAAIICGETQQEIARERRLALATVVTYRRRAYDKLGVRSRRALAALHERLRTGAFSEASRLATDRMMRQGD